MTRSFRAFSWAFIALPLAVGELAGQVSVPTDNTAYGTTAAEFLLLGAGARGLALGGGYAALSTDISALYYNPAGIAQLRAGIEGDRISDRAGRSQDRHREASR